MTSAAVAGAGAGGEGGTVGRTHPLAMPAEVVEVRELGALLVAAPPLRRAL